jgi:uncharacterized membrane protein YhaH (DUF805 family)
MKISLLTRVAPATILCLGSSLAFAQRQNQNAENAAQLARCGCCGTFIFVPIILLILNIALLVWVARDAKARGMDSSVLWMLLVFFTSFFGLIIYIFSRPQGNLIPCPNCQNKKLQAALKCPHCGFGG